MNKIFITGRLTRDPEMVTLSNGMEKCRFSVAVDRRRKKDAPPKADFFNCDAWGAQGAFIAKWFKKGSPITVTGRMESSQSEKDGSKVTFWAVTVETVEFQKGVSETRMDNAENAGGPKDPESGFEQVNTDELPF